MALADYFARNATAVGQVLSRFDEDIFKEKIRATRVGIGFGDAAQLSEGRALLDLAVRLVARLYPTLTIASREGADAFAAEIAALARSINPNIEIGEGEAEIEIAVGDDAPVVAPIVVYAGSQGWDAHLSTESPQRVGTTDNPLGAGAAACFACANVFRASFLNSPEHTLDHELRFSVLDRSAAPSQHDISLGQLQLDKDIVLVGLGAIGNSAVWALSRVPASGKIHLVDQQDIDLSNLQRYVLAARDDESRSKVEVAARFFASGLEAEQHNVSWADFVQSRGYCWRRVLVALDSARDRRAVQSALPYWIANAWTQPGDLGLSTHTFDTEGACLNCLYLPRQGLDNEDAIIAHALGVPERVMQIRELLFRNAGAPRELLAAVAAGLRVPMDLLLPFAGRPLHTLYVEGVCGGAVIPLGRTGSPRQDVHVPLAHQSALAGLLLAGACVADVIGASPPSTLVTRINLLRPLEGYPSQPAQKDPRGICICQDPDYRTAYRQKYSW